MEPVVRERGEGAPDEQAPGVHGGEATRAAGRIPAATVREMATLSSESYEVVCPHCHKEFRAETIGSGEQRGFKCPHCRLFVPIERADELEPADPPR